MPRCQECRRVLTKTTYYLPPAKQRARRFCSRACFNETMRTRGLAVVGKVEPPPREPPDSPLRVPTANLLPATCPRCNGLWRYSTEGETTISVQCRQCGRDLWVVAALPS